MQPHQDGEGSGDQEDSISFLLDASLNSQSGAGQPWQPPKPPPGASGWDVLLTQVNWQENHWREFNPLGQIPWSELLRDTVNYLAQQWDRYDKAHPQLADHQRLNPATEEQLRRFSARDSTAAQQAVQTQSVMALFSTNAETEAWPEDMSEDYGQPAAGDGGPPEGFYTFGFEIEFLVAAAAAGQDPLPGDGRWLDAGLAGDSPNSIKFMDRVQRAVADALNAHANIICTIKDEDEGSARHEAEMQNLDAMAQVTDPAAVDRVVEMAFDHANRYFFIAASNLRLHQATDADINRFVDLAANSPVVTALAAGDQVEVARRLRRRLRVAVYLSQCDALAVELPGMKHRYRSWSVSRVRDVRPDAAQAAHYANAPSGSAGAAAPRPADAYKWLAVKLSSPAMNGMAQEAAQGALVRVCQVLRSRFRIHRDLPGAIPLSTQVVASHSRGFTLLDLKKAATLARMLEDDLRRLHRRERTEPSAWRACASVATWSCLGGASFEDAARLSRDPAAPAWRVLPRPAPATRDYLATLMERHVPTAQLFARGTAADEVYYRALWLYTSVDQLSRALGPNRPGVQMGVMVKCGGLGRRTAAVADKDRREPLPFVEVDRQRGVIEFRYMPTSLDARHIMGWAAVCARFVVTAKDTDAAQFRAVVHGMLNGGAVLEAIGAPDDLMRGFRQGINSSNNGYFCPPDAPVDYYNPFYLKP